MAVPQVATLLQDVRLYIRLQQYDDDLAAEARAAGCHCGGRLHSARYRRKPRGGTTGMGEGYGWRWSFCCALEGCRRRVTPRSVRFLGPKVFLGAVVVLLSAVRGCVTGARLASLRRYVGVSRRTLKRWGALVADGLRGQPVLGKGARGLLPPPAPEPGSLPAALLNSFEGDEETRLASLLRFISPITTGSARSRLGM